MSSAPLAFCLLRKVVRNYLTRFSTSLRGCCNSHELTLLARLFGATIGLGHKMSSQHGRKPDRPRKLEGSVMQRNYHMRRTQSQFTLATSQSRANPEPPECMEEFRRSLRQCSNNHTRSHYADLHGEDEIQVQSARGLSAGSASQENEIRPMEASISNEISPVSVQTESGTSSSYPHDKFACRYAGCKIFTEDVLPCEFCASHCCHLDRDHAKIPAIKYFAHEPRNQSASRRCRYLRCTSMKLKTCRFYCLRHCCSKRHGDWDRLVAKSNRKKNRRNDWENTCEYK